MSHVKEVCGELVCGAISEVGDQDALVEAVRSLSSQLDDLVADLPAPVSVSAVSKLVGDVLSLWRASCKSFVLL